MLTPFPKMALAVISESILGRAEKKGQIKFHIRNLFDFSDPPHHRIDDYPFGGGAGMVLKPEPVFRAYDKVLKQLPENSEAVNPILAPPNTVQKISYETKSLLDSFLLAAKM